MNARPFAATVALAMLAVAPAFAAVSLPSGTKLNVQLAAPVNTAQLHPNDVLLFNVVAPYPEGATELAGATVSAYITSVSHGSSTTRASVGFQFNRIRFEGGGSAMISAIVLAKNFTPDVPKSHAAGASEGTLTSPNSQSLPGLGPPAKNSLLWAPPKVKSGQSNGPAASGGTAYAKKPGGDVTVPKGTPITLELTRALTVH